MSVKYSGQKPRALTSVSALHTSRLFPTLHAVTHPSITWSCGSHLMITLTAPVPCSDSSSLPPLRPQALLSSSSLLILLPEWSLKTQLLILYLWPLSGFLLPLEEATSVVYYVLTVRSGSCWPHIFCQHSLPGPVIFISHGSLKMPQGYFLALVCAVCAECSDYFLCASSTPTHPFSASLPGPGWSP